MLAHALILVEGDIAPGAEAVARLHADLGLPPVATSAHTTLSGAFGDHAADPEALAERLATTAMAAVAAPDLHIAG